MPILNAHAAVAVKDLEIAVEWYQKLLQRPPLRPMPEVAQWSFDHGGALQVYLLPQRVGAGSFTLTVTSLKEQLVRLVQMDIDIGNQTANRKVKTVMITDPDGNHIAFAEPLDPSLAQ